MKLLIVVVMLLGLSLSACGEMGSEYAQYGVEQTATVADVCQDCRDEAAACEEDAAGCEDVFAECIDLHSDQYPELAAQCSRPTEMDCSECQRRMLVCLRSGSNACHLSVCYLEHDDWGRDLLDPPAELDGCEMPDLCGHCAFIADDCMSTGAGDCDELYAECLGDYEGCDSPPPAL